MVALGIIGSTTVIPDFVRNLTDSEILIGFSGNIFTVGFALPNYSSPTILSAMNAKSGGLLARIFQFVLSSSFLRR